MKDLGLVIVAQLSGRLFFSLRLSVTHPNLVVVKLMILLRWLVGDHERLIF